ncbi:hypothetical protein TeGR_g9842, partial [Tetraparma gracilis]
MGKKNKSSKSNRKQPAPATAPDPDSPPKLDGTFLPSSSASMAKSALLPLQTVDVPPTPPRLGIASVQLVISKAAHKLGREHPELFPSAEQLAETAGVVFQDYIDELRKKNKFDFTLGRAEHSPPSLCCFTTRGVFDLDAILAADEASMNTKSTAAGNTAPPPPPVVSRHFTFRVDVGDNKGAVLFSLKYEMNDTYAVDEANDEGGDDDVQLYHDLLRLWGEHEERPAAISKSIMDKCFAEIKSENTGIEGIADEIRDFVFAPHAVRPAEMDEDEDLPCALLLHGPPGTGKTTIIRSILEKVGVFTVWLGTAAELKRPYIGQTEKAIKFLFDECKKNPHVLCAIFWDEIDNVTEQRGGDKADHKQDWISLLLRMIGSKDYPNLLLIGSTNRKSAMDEAILRPGRLDQQYFFGTLSPGARWELFKKRCANTKLKIPDALVGEGVRAFFEIATINLSGSGVRQAASHMFRALRASQARGETLEGLEPTMYLAKILGKHIDKDPRALFRSADLECFAKGGLLTIVAARYGWTDDLWGPSTCNFENGVKDVTDIVRGDVVNGGELHINPDCRGQYMNEHFWPVGPGIGRRLSIKYRYGDGPVQTTTSEKVANETVSLHVTAAGSTGGAGSGKLLDGPHMLDSNVNGVIGAWNDSNGKWRFSKNAGDGEATLEYPRSKTQLLAIAGQLAIDSGATYVHTLDVTTLKLHTEGRLDKDHLNLVFAECDEYSKGSGAIILVDVDDLVGVVESVDIVDWEWQ